MSHEETYAASRAAFDAYAGLTAPHLPPDDMSSLQVRLFRWEQQQFGWQPFERVALGIAEEVGELDEAATKADQVDALGDIMVYATQLATAFRLDFGTILVHTSPAIVPHVSRAVGRICHAVLKSAQGIRGFDDTEKTRRAVCAGLSDLYAALQAYTSTSVMLSYTQTAEKVLQRNWKANPGGPT